MTKPTANSLLDFSPIALAQISITGIIQQVSHTWKVNCYGIAELGIGENIFLSLSKLEIQCRIRIQSPQNQQEIFEGDDCFFIRGRSIQFKWKASYNLVDSYFVVFIEQIKDLIGIENECSVGFQTQNKTIIQKSILNQLNESENKFRKAFDSAAIGMAIVGLDGSWIKVNDSLCAMFGYEKSELLKRTFQDITHPEDLHADLELMQQVMNEERDSYQMEKRYFHRKGKVVWAILAVSLVRNLSGEPMYFVSQITDISHRKRAEKKLFKTHSKLQSILNTNANVSVIVTNRKGVITLFNKGAEAMLGYSAKEMVNRVSPIGIHKQEELQNRSVELSKKYNRQIDGFDVFTEQAKQGQSESREWTYVRKDGSTFPVQLVVSAVRNHENELEGFVWVGIDITDLKQAQIRAEQSAIEKERFLANMSHEIRTPLNGILGFTGLLAQTKLSEEQTEHIGAIQLCGKNLLLLINDILDFAKIQAGMMTLETKPFELRKTLRDVTILMGKQFEEKGLTFSVEVSDDVPDLLNGDGLRLIQILMNLVTNALKFTETGGAILQASLVTNSDEQVVVHFSVSDTGIGIASKNQTTIFERFNQAHTETTRKYGGSGLGLSIVQGLLKLQNSEIQLASRLGNGTTFSFELGFAPQKHKVEVAAFRAVHVKQHEQRKLSILLAEDNIINQRLASMVLAQFGYHSEIAENGKRAIEKFQANVYDLILMDMQMPEMDGYEATRIIRNDFKSDIPIIAITAHVMSGEREKCLGLGMNEYISKPFNPIDLQKAIFKVTGTF